MADPTPPVFPGVNASPLAITLWIAVPHKDRSLLKIPISAQRTHPQSSHFPLDIWQKPDETLICLKKIMDEGERIPKLDWRHEIMSAHHKEALTECTESSELLIRKYNLWIWLGPKTFPRPWNEVSRVGCPSRIRKIEPSVHEGMCKSDGWEKCAGRLQGKGRIADW